ncbi:hypothetical protein D9M68_680450 [compost metagenome]
MLCQHLASVFRQVLVVGLVESVLQRFELGLEGLHLLLGHTFHQVAARRNRQIDRQPLMIPLVSHSTLKLIEDNGHPIKQGQQICGFSRGFKSWFEPLFSGNGQRDAEWRTAITELDVTPALDVTDTAAVLRKLLVVSERAADEFGELLGVSRFPETELLSRVFPAFADGQKPVVTLGI